MKKAIVLLTVWAAVAVAQTAVEKTTQPQAAAKGAKTAPRGGKTVPPAAAPAKPVTRMAVPLEIPKEAIKQPDGGYKFTDKNGKRWVYNQTFGGVSRMDDMSDPAAPRVKQAAAFDKFSDDGEVIHFERQGPFGPMKWDRKKAELTEEERNAIATFKPAEKQ